MRGLSRYREARNSILRLDSAEASVATVGRGRRLRRDRAAPVKRLLQLLRGFPGHPSHPLFTDVTVGAFTVGTALTVLGWFGVSEADMVRGGFLALVAGLVFAVGTILTGFLDYVRIRGATPLKRTATIHWISTVSATLIFLLAAILLRRRYEVDEVSLGAMLVAVLGWVALLFGGWVGGSIVFVYGMRVIMEPSTPTGEALKPKLR